MRFHYIRFPLAVILALRIQASLFATDRYYHDVEEYSDSTRFRLTATSPDNQSSVSTPFAADFTYVLTDTEDDRVLWTRQQPMSTEKGSSGEEWRWPDEGSPVQAFVSDEGWSVIRLAGDDYLMVDRSGKDRGKINLVDAAFSDEERKEHISWSTAGSYWPEIVSHFLSDTEVFVIRTGWGRIIALNLQTGSVTDTTPEIVEQAVAVETVMAIDRLRYGRTEPDDCLNLPHLGDAIFLAVEFQLKEAIGVLHQLEESEEITSSTFGGGSVPEAGSDDVDPHRYRTFGVRSSARWALRRLGQPTRRGPLHEFGYRDERDAYFRPPVPEVAARVAVEQIVKGMSAREVLELMGSPTDVDGREWIFLIDDAPEPFELVLQMNHRSVAEIIKRKPVSQVR